MKNVFTLLLVVSLAATFTRCKQAEQAGEPHQATTLRAPAYPLVTIDPYTSAWSATDNLYDSPVRHWTGKVQSLIGAVRVDGNVFRFLGKEDLPLKSLVPMAGEKGWEAMYTHQAPAKGWEQATFNAKSWKTGMAAFGSPGMKAVNTVWDNKTKEIWVRREFTLPEVKDGSELFLIYSHDDDFELYLNGKEIVNTGNAARSDIMMKLDPAMVTAGKNVIAAHCTDRGGLAYVDFGIYTKGGQAEVFKNAAVQENVALSATQTQYKFTCGPVGLALNFISPLLLNNLDLVSRPVNYITYEVSSKDGKAHDVEVYFEMTPQWAVNEMHQEVGVSKGKTGSVEYVKAGTTAQPVLQKVGDNVRIDWGYAYLAAGLEGASKTGIGKYSEAKENFAAQGSVTAGAENVTAVMTEEMPVMTYVNDLGDVTKATSGYVMVGYDDVFSLQYFGTDLKAWWTQDGKVTMDNVLEKAAADRESIISQCNQFDNELWNETLKGGGKNYADLCVLAYRQSIAAHKLAKDGDGNILFLSKENFSNGSIGTVDVTYPSAPLFLRYNPDLLKGMMNPIFYFSESGKWTKPFAAHDVGTYPKANGQTYGGDMPVEECGNMLILTGAIANREGNADYAKKHWKVLTVWADYLQKNGLDPENQLCTDDFAGHFAHNTNLSVKAIMGIASYSMLADMLGKKDTAEIYHKEAARMAQEWVKMADAGDHYRLTFDKPDTWSQKYNMVWDKLLGFNLFPKEVVQKELAYYLTKQNQFGLPLDNRRTYTKSDWIIWTATLADDQQTFQKFIDPVHGYVTNTPSRVPMSDWYETPDAKQVGFQARSVVGGYFIKLLEK